MRSYILTISARLIVPVMLLFSVFILFRGHNQPGGGFAGGLIAGAAFVLLAFANGVDFALRKIPVQPTQIIASGLLISLLSGIPGLLMGDSFFKGYWLDWDLPILPKLGTPFMFDVGVYLLVMGIVLVIVFPNIKED